mgnify:CR=1 FL=1
MKARLFSMMMLGLGAAAIASLPVSAQAQSTDYNYVGLGVGVGEIGDSDVGLAVTSKFSVGNNLSVRPGVVSDLNFSGDGATQFTVPLTYDFNAITRDGKLLPYAGGGVAVTTEGNGDVGPLLTAGLDYRLNDRVTLNGGVNLSFYDNTTVNGVVGIGYTF